jgi:CO/xanthine dehydrogenase Mo-binding subunit
MGQGAHTTLAQVAAEELGLPFDAVTVGEVSTAVVPYDQGSSASRTITVMGIAVQAAARHAREQLAAIASAAFGCPAEALHFESGVVTGPNGRESYADLISRRFGMPGGEIVGQGSALPRPRADGKLGAVPYWEIGAAGAALSVDPDTGRISLREYVTVADVGTAVNPTIVEGQDHGAAMQGIGHALFETLHCESGQLLNGNFIDYRVPRFDDLPDDFTSVLIEKGDGPGPFGLKGCGESGVISAAPAVANALFRATGVRLRRLPLSPEAVWRAMSAGDAGED